MRCRRCHKCLRLGGGCVLFWPRGPGRVRCRGVGGFVLAFLFVVFGVGPPARVRAANGIRTTPRRLAFLSVFLSHLVVFLKCSRSILKVRVTLGWTLPPAAAASSSWRRSSAAAAGSALGWWCGSSSWPDAAGSTTISRTSVRVTASCPVAHAATRRTVPGRRTSRRIPSDWRTRSAERRPPHPLRSVVRGGKRRPAHRVAVVIDFHYVLRVRYPTVRFQFHIKDRGGGFRRRQWQGSVHHTVAPLLRRVLGRRHQIHVVGKLRIAVGTNIGVHNHLVGRQLRHAPNLRCRQQIGKRVDDPQERQPQQKQHHGVHCCRLFTQKLNGVSLSLSLSLSLLSLSEYLCLPSNEEQRWSRLELQGCDQD